MQYSSIFSILFLMAGIASLLCGLYIIEHNSKAHINRAFLGIAIALMIWSLGFAIGNSSSDMQSCILWQRVAAFGWGFIFSVLLHFILILTEKTSLLRKWWIYIALYLPAIVTVCAFGLPIGLNSVPYQFTNTSLGWVKETQISGWDYFQWIYYTVFTITGLVLIWLWGRHSLNKQIKKQALVLFISFTAAYLLGTLTDVVFQWFPIAIPPMSPMIMLIPVSAVCYIIKHYGFLIERPIDQNEVILNESSRSKIYKYLYVTFIAGSIINFAAQYVFYQEGTLTDVLFFSGFLLIIAVAIIIISRLHASEKAKENLLSLVFAVVIPMITLRYSHYGSITIWAFALILMIVCLLYNKRTILVTIFVSAVITQVIIWMISPTALVEVNKADYLVRIGILSIAAFLALYVNKVFVFKLKDNALQMRFQKMISEATYDFVNINQSNLEEKINHMLSKMGAFFQIDHTYVCLFNPQQDTMTCSYEWCTQEIELQNDDMREVPFNAIPWWMGHIEDVSKLPDEEKELREKLVSQNIKSFLSIPIEGEDIVYGFIGIDSMKSVKKWTDEHVKMFRIFANLLADGLAKIEAEKNIEYLAYYDHLTGLPNRTLFTDRVTQAIHLAKRSANFLGIMFIDLDSFKAVNDTMGHNGGDMLIKEIATKLSQRLRKSDTVARFGGDEFMILLNNISTGEHVAKVAGNVMGIFEKPFVINGQEFFITASGGVAIYPVDGEDADTLIKNADIAMYKAKSMGKNQHVLCTTDMKDEVQRNMLLSNSLYHAHERNELVIYYQPQISLQTNMVIGLEALLRWQHPEMGMISPGVFIPLAENSGLINNIGEWVLRNACRQNMLWQKAGLPHLRMAVNLSVNQFKNPKLVDVVKDTLQETGLNPKYLELEITESVAVRESDYIINVLNRLKELGVSISIDDFGTEYSSLSRLKMLPIDRIKIDMQFVQGIEGSEKDQAITKVIINLAKSLGLKVIAEGVETAPQLEFLNQKLCDEVQGFYYYKPLPADEVEVILKQNFVQSAIAPL